MAEVFIHTAAIVETTDIGEDTRIWAFVHVAAGARIGQNCNICDHCYIEKGVSIGDHVTVKSGVYLWEGVTVENNVFIGPNVVFTNDLRPRSKLSKPALKTLLRQSCSLGANTTILAGISIGRYAMTGIGALVTRDVPDHALVYGNPARIRGWVDEQGEKLQPTQNEKEWISKHGCIFVWSESGLIKKEV